MHSSLSFLSEILVSWRHSTSAPRRSPIQRARPADVVLSLAALDEAEAAAEAAEAALADVALIAAFSAVGGHPLTLKLTRRIVLFFGGCFSGPSGGGDEPGGSSGRSTFSRGREF